MGLFEFSRGNGIIGGPLQEYINRNFPTCPMCGTREPYWKLKGKMEFDNRVQFCCDECRSVFSMTAADLIGLSKHSGNLLAWAYAGPAVAANAVHKTLKGKRIGTTYVRIDSIGTIQTPRFSKGEEVPIEEMQRIAAEL